MKQNVFVINSGSSSLKFQLINMEDESLLCKGLFEKIGSKNGTLYSIKYGGNQDKDILHISTHEEAVDYLLDEIVNRGIVSSLEEIDSVGHRVAHGGEYKNAQVIDADVLETIEGLSPFAPSHNPVNLIGIKAFQRLLPNIKQVAVFDTSFHQTIPEEYFIYPIPYKYYEEQRIRKYGFHGTSHQFVSDSIEGLLGKDGAHKVISCHLGNGASICAIKDGKSINTSMGFTPLAGLMMGTRSGDIDPSVLEFLETENGLSGSEVNQILNKESGLLGVSGLSNDLRDLESAAHEGNERAELALKMFVNRIAETIAQYMVTLSGVDCIVFTAGIGENSAYIRSKVCEKLAVFGIAIDQGKNNNSEQFIEKADSNCKIAVIPTNEEIMIARETIKAK